MTFGWRPNSCRNITSRNVLWESVGLRKASKIFLRAIWRGWMSEMNGRDTHDLLSLPIESSPNDPIRSLSQPLLKIVSLDDMRIDIFRHLKKNEWSAKGKREFLLEVKPWRRAKRRERERRREREGRETSPTCPLSYLFIHSLTHTRHTFDQEEREMLTGTTLTNTWTNQSCHNNLLFGQG